MSRHGLENKAYISRLNNWRVMSRSLGTGRFRSGWGREKGRYGAEGGGGWEKSVLKGGMWGGGVGGGGGGQPFADICQPYCNLQC